MGLRLARFAILAAMTVGALLLAVTWAYFVHGSLEEFPPAEQQEKIRVVMAVIASGLVALEVGLFLALRWIGRASANRESESSPRAA
jgi:hypothetical protein